MVFKNLCILALSTKIASALGLKGLGVPKGKRYSFYNLVSNEMFTRPSSPSRPVLRETISIPRGIFHIPNACDLFQVQYSVSHNSTQGITAVGVRFLFAAVTSKHLPLSQQFTIGFSKVGPYMVLASRASGCFFRHPNPQKEPLRTPKKICVEFLKISISSL